MNTNYYAKLAKNKSLLKEYKTSESDRSVYLNDGDEFQIQLFNPETTEICARIWIEDIQLSHDIVLRPGERLWLERYTDIAKKFKFETYVVDANNGAVRDAISHNGNIKIEFYRRKTQIKQYSTITVSPCNLWEYTRPPHEIDITWNTCCDSTSNKINGYSDANIYYTSDINTSSVNTSLGMMDSCCSISNGTLYSTSAITTTEPKEKSAVCNDNWHRDKANLETGRIGEGRHSNQKFDNVNMEFEWWPFRTENIKIYPFSRKPYNAKDLKKIYCSNCGRKLNDKYKFCPYCGSKID